MNRWLALTAIAVLLSICGTGCTMGDPEYASKLSQAQTDWKGNEIAGVWISKLKMLVEARTTWLLRPDGTGIWRQTGDRQQGGTWRYDGRGVWKWKPGYTWGEITIHYTGNELLADWIWAGAHTQYVFVRADDDAKVEEYKRQKQM